MPNNNTFDPNFIPVGTGVPITVVEPDFGNGEPGNGCGTGSDGIACSPAYLCPTCINLLIVSVENR